MGLIGEKERRGFGPSRRRVKHFGPPAPASAELPGQGRRRSIQRAMRKDHTIPRGELHRLVHKSDRARRQFAGRSDRARVLVWTPPGWKPGEAMPLLVDLKGYWSSALAHANWQPHGENVPERLDRLAHEGMARARRGVSRLLHRALRQPISQQRRLRPLRRLHLRRDRAVRGSQVRLRRSRAGAACSANPPAAMARPGTG